MPKILNFVLEAFHAERYVSWQRIQRKDQGTKMFSRKAAAGEVRGSRSDLPGQTKCRGSLHLVKFVLDRSTGTA